MKPIAFLFHSLEVVYHSIHISLLEWRRARRLKRIAQLEDQLKSFA
jgi:hypothetical protein